MGRLLHFYERHLIEVGYKQAYKTARERLSELVDPDILLDCTINYGLYYVNHYFSSGKAVCTGDIEGECRYGHRLPLIFRRTWAFTPGPAFWSPK